MSEKVLTLKQYTTRYIKTLKADYPEATKEEIAIQTAGMTDYEYTAYLNQQAKAGADIPWYIMDTLEPHRVRYLLHESPENSPIRKYMPKEVRKLKCAEQG